MTDQDDERAAVVAFLREQSATTIINIRPADARETEDCVLVMGVLSEAANRIEAGDHRKETGK